jgi:hypothetical protein
VKTSRRLLLVNLKTPLNLCSGKRKSTGPRRRRPPCASRARGGASSCAAAWAAWLPRVHASSASTGATWGGSTQQPAGARWARKTPSNYGLKALVKLVERRHSETEGGGRLLIGHCVKSLLLGALGKEVRCSLGGPAKPPSLLRSAALQVDQMRSKMEQKLYALVTQERPFTKSIPVLKLMHNIHQAYTPLRKLMHNKHQAYTPFRKTYAPILKIYAPF